MKTYEDNKSGQKSEIAHWKNNFKKIDEKSLQFFSLDKKATEKLMNQISDFKELECEKYVNINQ